MADCAETIQAAFDRVEQDILPGLSTMLDAVIDAAMLGQPGVDAARYGAELRRMGVELEALTRQVESLLPRSNGVGAARARSAA